MADTKISGLTSLAAADVETDADTLAIVDDSATATKKITVDDLRTAMGPKLDTALATTSGTTKDFTIPSWARKVTVMLDGVSVDGTEELLIQLGDSGGVETTGYLAASIRITTTPNPTAVTFTTGFGINTANAATTVHSGAVVLTLLSASTNTWTAHGAFALTTSSDGGVVVGGSKSLSGTLTTVRITSTNTPDDFDAGSVNVLVE